MLENRSPVMKRSTIATLAAMIASFAVRDSSFAQGSLTPSGPPAPTMKTLAQIEPRIPISASFNITNSGSYYVTTNLAVSSGNGIIISANNVTLDLNGFALSGAPGSFLGISINGARTNITIRNGSLNGWGGDGVEGSSFGSIQGGIIEQLTVSGNGGYGIRIAGSALVRDCVSRSNAVDGIQCVGCLVTDCVVSENRHGILANASIVSRCLAKNNRLSGILVNGSSCQIIGNNCFGNNTLNNAFHAGIALSASTNLIEGNRVSSSGNAGIFVDTTYTGNIITKNIVSGNGPNNYVNPGGNDFGPVGTAAVATSPWANISD
jgi:parallel beta-helix repeat protein